MRTSLLRGGKKWLLQILSMLVRVSVSLQKESTSYTTQTVYHIEICADLTLAWVFNNTLLFIRLIEMRNSKFFFRHPLLQPYRYYWRVE